MEPGDWRAQLPADSRRRIVNMITDALKRHVPFFGHEGLLKEFEKTAVRFEEEIYTAAKSQVEYLEKISLKLQTLETRPQNPMPTAKSVTSPEGSLESTARTGNANVGDWQEEVYQKIKAMKDLYLLDLKDIHQKVVGKLQQQTSFAQQREKDLKVFKNMLERYMAFLQLPKHNILPFHQDKLSIYESQIHHLIANHRTSAATQQQPPPPQPQPLPPPPQPQILPPPYMHHMQQNMMSSMQPTFYIDPGQNSSMNDLAAKMSNANGGDWQEEVYQKIKAMKDLYLVELKDIHRCLLVQIQKEDSVPQQPNNKLIDALKSFKIKLESHIEFLQIPKYNILAEHKDNLIPYEKHIVRIITTRPRKPAATQPPPPPPQPLPPPLMHSMQQNRIISMQPSFYIDPRLNSSMNGAQQVNINPMVSQNQMALLHPTSQMGNANGGDWVEEVYQKIKAMKDLYLVELKDIHRSLLVQIQKEDSVPQQPDNKLLEKLKFYKIKLESYIEFLQIPKHNILPDHKDNLIPYEKHIVHIITTRPRKPKTATQQPPQPLPPPLMHHMQQNMMTSMQPTFNIDTRQHISMNGAQQVNMNPMVAHNQIAQMGNANGGDWREEVYQKIKAMKDLYLLDLNHVHQKTLVKIQQHDSLPQQPNNEQLEKLKVFKNILEHQMAFLQIPKHNILPIHRDNLSTYKKQIVHCITSNRRKSAATQQQPPPTQPLPPPHMQ